MSERLQARAEGIKLDRLIGLDPELQSAYEQLPSEDLAEFRERATARLFDGSQRALARVAAGAKLLPAGVIAKIAEGSFGPLLCARAAGAVDPDKAIEVAGKLSADFLTDTAIELDPRRVAEIIGKVDEDLVVPVARELGRREEYVTMGRFLAFVRDDSIAAAIGALTDEALLRTAFVLEHKDRLDNAVSLLPRERLPGVLSHATELELWPEALDLVDHLDSQRGWVADTVAEQDEAVIEALVGSVHEGGIWDTLLPIVRTMSEEPRRLLASRKPFHEREVLGAIIDAAADQGLWVDLVPLIEVVPGDVLGTVSEIAVALEEERLKKILADAVEHPETIPTLLNLVSPALLERIAGLDDEVLGGLIGGVHEAGLWRDLLPLVGHLDDEARAGFASKPPFHDREILAAIIGIAADEGLWQELVPLVESVPESVLGDVAAAATELDESQIARIVTEAAEHPESIPALRSVLTPALIGRVASEHEQALIRLSESVIASGDQATFDALAEIIDGLDEDALAPIIGAIEAADQVEVARLRAKLEASEVAVPDALARVLAASG